MSPAMERLSRTCNLAENENLHVGELYVYGRVAYVSAFDDFLGNLFGKFRTGLSGAVYLTDDRHVKVAVFVHRTNLEGVYSIYRSASERIAREGVVGGGGIERRCEFRVLAADYDRQPVKRLYAYPVVVSEFYCRVLVEILEIDYSLLR